MTKTIIQKSKKAAAGVLMSALLMTAACPLQGCASSSYTADTTFTFSDSAIAASGSTDNYEIDGTDLKITAAGTYVVTGSCDEGSVTVKKGTTGVTLVLRDLSLASSTTAPVSCNKTTEVSMILEGSSTLTDKEDPANEDSEDEAVADAFEGAALKVKSGGNLTISGTGTLTADGSSCKNAVKGASTAVITVDSGTLNAKAANNGLASDGSVVINGGTINVAADNDGIKSEPDEDDADSAGTVTINGGTVTLDVTGDGIQSTGDLSINGGSVTIEADDDAINSDANTTVKAGTLNIKAGDDAIHAESVLTIGTKGSGEGPDITVSSCEEGLEGAEIYLNSGSGVITASDDGVNAANKDLSNYNFLLDIEGGSWTIDANGDGLDSNKDIVINGGTTLVFGSVNNGNGAMDYEGTCTVNSGSLLCVGMSGMAMGPSTGTYVMFGGNGTGMGGGRMGQMPFERGEQNGQTTEMGSQNSGMTEQNGGRMQRPQRPDQTGSDSQMPMMPGSDNNGSQMPAMPEFENDGSQMPSMPGNMNGQPQAQAAGNSLTISAGSKLVIKDASGNTVMETTALKNANNVMFSSDSLTSGSEYTLYIDGTEAGTATAAEGNGQNGGMPGQPGENGGQPQTPDQTGGNGGMPQTPEQTGGNSGQPQAADQTNANEQQTDDTASAYTDVKSNDWFAPAVGFVSKKKYMVGTSGKTFEPNALLNRAMMVQILYNMEGKPQVSKTASYKDVSSSDWYADAVSWAEDNQLVLGYGNGSFGASDPLTREQAAVLLKRYAEYKGLSLNINADLSAYTDANKVSDWALDAVKFAVGLKVINGTSATTLDPAGTATRAQMAQILMNFLQR